MKNTITLIIVALIITAISSCSSSTDVTEGLEFKRAQINVRISGELKGSSPFKGSWEQKMTIEKCAGNGKKCFEGVTPTPTFAICCTNNNGPYSYSNNYIYANVETSTHTVSNLVANTSGSSSSQYLNIPDSYSSTFSVSLNNAVYKEVEGGYEILYTGQALKEITPIIKYSTSRTSRYNNTISTSSSVFNPSGEYASDDFIRITLYK